MKRLLTRDLQLLAVCNAAEAAMRFGAFVLYSSALGPARLGTLASMVAFTALVNQIAHLGIDTSVISLGSREVSEHKRRLRIVQAGFMMHLVVGVALAGIGCLLASPVARRFFDDPSLAFTLTLVSLGIPLARLSSFALSVLRTYQRFGHYAASSLIAAVVQLSGVASLLWLGSLSVLGVIVVSVIAAPLVQLLVGFAGVPRGVCRLRIPSRDVVSRILGFGKWIWGTSLLSGGIRRINILLLIELAGSTVTGHFHMARRYASFLALIFEPIRRYLVPKLTALTSRAQLGQALKRIYASLSWTLLLVPAAWLVSSVVITRLHGAEWAPVVPLFQIVVLARLIGFLAQPVSFALFALQRPYIQTRLHLFLFVAYLIAAPPIILRWSALGSAWCMVAVSATSLVVLTLCVWRLVGGSHPDVIGSHPNRRVESVI